MRNFYVRTSGSDSNDGSDEHPFLTQQKALAEAEAGDTIWIHGTYRDAVVIQSESPARVVFTDCEFLS